VGQYLRKIAVRLVFGLGAGFVVSEIDQAVAVIDFYIEHVEHAET
jgi:hypothetical protein